MTYLFYGTEEYFIKKEIERLKLEAEIEEINISQYRFFDTTMDLILEDANTLSLFSSKKMIIVNDAYFFGIQTKNKISDSDTEKLLQYLEHANPNTYLIFVTDKINTSKKLTKTMKKYGVIKEFSEVKDPVSFIKEELQDYEISLADIRHMISLVGKNNTLLLQKEVEKLKYYKYDTKKITREDIDCLIHRNIDTDIFHLIDTIVNKKKDEAMEMIEELRKENEEPIKIIILLANQFRLMWQTRSLTEQGYREDEIAKKLAVHPYPVKLALQKSRNYPKENLLMILDQLADLDYQIKSGAIDKNLALELFILGL